MPNTSIVTATAKQSTAQAIIDYGNGAAAHLGSDWMAHSAVRVLGVPYTDDHGDTSADDSIRLTVTDPDTDAQTTVVIPANFVGSSAITGLAPIIVLQPQNQNVPPGTLVQFLVGAISDTPLSYQWRKNSSGINGATALTLVLPNVVAASAGNYDVLVSNSSGSTFSSTGTLNVDVQYAAPGEGLFETLHNIAHPGFRIIKRLFGG